MSYVKRKLEDIIVDWKNGLDIAQIAEKNDVSRAWVKDSIDLYKEGMFYEEEES